MSFPVARHRPAVCEDPHRGDAQDLPSTSSWVRLARWEKWSWW